MRGLQNVHENMELKLNFFVAKAFEIHTPSFYIMHFPQTFE